MMSWIRDIGKFSTPDPLLKLAEMKNNDVLLVFNMALFMFLFSACSMGQKPVDKMIEPDFTQSATIDESTYTPATTNTPTRLPIVAHTPTLLLLPANTPLVDSEIPACSPLENIPLNELENAIVNPFKPPKNLMTDDPHQGVDLADLHEIGDNGQIAMSGLSVNSISNGTVVMVLEDRFPYGNALMIETSLDVLPAELRESLELSIPTSTGVQSSPLTCPEIDMNDDWDVDEKSIYILYAHIKDSLTFNIEDEIECGQKIGEIGESGNALNPHLHIEVRLGPAGFRFPNMAHYDSSVSMEEMANYCIWRISGMFQLVDPMIILSVG
jgi:hypothetical protein